MSERARLVGLNHVALVVGDVGEALAWYGRFFDFTLRGRAGRMAFIDMGDQFIALAQEEPGARDTARHVGLVVVGRERALAALREAGADVDGNDVHDPWGNLLQLVEYADVQFTKAPEVLRALGLAGAKSERARAELRAKGIEPA